MTIIDKELEFQYVSYLGAMGVPIPKSDLGAIPSATGKYIITIGETVYDNVEVLDYEYNIVIEILGDDGVPVVELNYPIEGEDYVVIMGTMGEDLSSFTDGTTKTYHIIIKGIHQDVIAIDEKFLVNKPGLKTEGKTFTIDNETVIADIGAEIFNNYTGNIATGKYSHAEGYCTIASGYCSHAEGNHTIASGDGSHAEGFYTKASGNFSHAEGNGTTASGDGSHAEGLYTIASGKNQHVQGRWSIEDTTNKYAHIVGNGTQSKRSNAHTLDWNGNAWYQGDVYVGGASQDDTENIKKLATEEYVNSKSCLVVVANCNANGNITSLDKTMDEISTAMSMYNIPVFIYVDKRGVPMYKYNSYDMDTGIYTFDYFNPTNKSMHLLHISSDDGVNISSITTEEIKLYESNAMVLSSPNGTRFSITIGDDGVLTASEITA